MTERVLLVHTGGTLGMAPSRAPDAGTSATLSPAPSVARILEQVPELEELAELRLTVALNRDSATMEPEHILGLARLIREQGGDCDGVVLIHGTDTMAYTASVLGFLLAGSGQARGAHRLPAAPGLRAQRRPQQPGGCRDPGHPEGAGGRHLLRRPLAARRGRGQAERPPLRGLRDPQPAAPGGAGAAHPDPSPRRGVRAPGARGPRRDPGNRVWRSTRPSRACPGACPAGPRRAC